VRVGAEEQQEEAEQQDDEGDDHERVHEERQCPSAPRDGNR
jgi:hypothetical protein